MRGRPVRPVNHLRNALVRSLRDLRLTLADRYRALLASRFVALAALAAAVLDEAAGAAGAIRRRRRGRARAPLHAAAVADAVLAAGRQLSVTVRSAASAPSLVLRRADDVVAIDTLVDAVVGIVRMVGVVPAGTTGTWTVGLIDRDDVVDLGVDPRTAAGLPAPLTADERGRLTVDLDPDADVGVPADLTVGVRTMLVGWPAGGDGELCLVPADGTAELRLRAPARDGRATATVDLAALTATSWTAYRHDAAGRVPIALPPVDYPPMKRFAAAHRVTLPADAAGAARVVSVGYAGGNRLTIRIESSTTAAT